MMTGTTSFIETQCPPRVPEILVSHSQIEFQSSTKAKLVFNAGTIMEPNKIGN